jgi:hypothetical protein
MEGGTASVRSEEDEGGLEYRVKVAAFGIGRGPG